MVCFAKQTNAHIVFQVASFSEAGRTKGKRAVWRVLTSFDPFYLGRCGARTLVISGSRSMHLVSQVSWEKGAISGPSGRDGQTTYALMRRLQTGGMCIRPDAKRRKSGGASSFVWIDSVRSRADPNTFRWEREIEACHRCDKTEKSYGVHRYNKPISLQANTLLGQPNEHRKKGGERGNKQL